MLQQETSQSFVSPTARAGAHMEKEVALARSGNIAGARTDNQDDKFPTGAENAPGGGTTPAPAAAAAGEDVSPGGAAAPPTPDNNASSPAPYSITIAGSHNLAPRSDADLSGAESVTPTPSSPSKGSGARVGAPADSSGGAGAKSP